jgi:hypothetical protein
MVTRASRRPRKSSSRKPRRQRGHSNTTSAAATHPTGISTAERCILAQEEARWIAESDLRTLRQAEEIRRDPARLKQAATMAAEEMKALQALQAIRWGR